MNLTHEPPFLMGKRCSGFRSFGIRKPGPMLLGTDSWYILTGTGIALATTPVGWSTMGNLIFTQQSSAGAETLKQCKAKINNGIFKKLTY